MIFIAGGFFILTQENDALGDRALHAASGLRGDGTGLAVQLFSAFLGEQGWRSSYFQRFISLLRIPCLRRKVNVGILNQKSLAWVT